MVEVVASHSLEIAEEHRNLQIVGERRKLLSEVHGKVAVGLLHLDLPSFLLADLRRKGCHGCSF